MSVAKATVTARDYDTMPCPSDANEMVRVALDEALTTRGYDLLVNQDLDLINELEEQVRESLWGSDATLRQAAEWAVDWTIETRPGALLR